MPYAESMTNDQWAEIRAHARLVQDEELEAFLNCGSYGVAEGPCSQCGDEMVEP